MSAQPYKIVERSTGTTFFFSDKTGDDPPHKQAEDALARLGAENYDLYYRQAGARWRDPPIWIKANK